MQQYDNSSVEVGAVSSPQLSRLQGNLASHYLLDSPPEDRHDVREVDRRRTGVGVIVTTPVHVFSLKVCQLNLSPGPTCTRDKVL